MCEVSSVDVVNVSDLMWSDLENDLLYSFLLYQVLDI